MDNNNRLRSIWNGLTRCGCNTQYVTSADVNTFSRRMDNEGPEFYARGFASLRADLLTGLEKGWFEISSTCRFHKRKGTGLPAFLFKAWSAIFETEPEYLIDDTGVSLSEAARLELILFYEELGENPPSRLGCRLRANVDVGAVSCLNQLLAVFTKIEGGHTPASEDECLQRFLDTEAELKELIYTGRVEEQIRHSSYRFETNRCTVATILERARTLVCLVLADCDPREIIPKHGSGVSACRTPVRARYGRPRYIQAIDDIWPYSDYYYASYSHLIDDMKSDVITLTGLSPLEELGGPFHVKNTWLEDLEEYTPCAKILVVPKDARGPRIISCEPRETMWIQQGALGVVVPHLEAHPLTTGLLNFTDQTVNQEQVFIGSITGESCSLDLKDASDRVSCWLVKKLFPENWFRALMAMRSATTEMPDGTLVQLAKHAPMGSATCFPIMALCIWSILTAATNMQSGSLPKRMVNGKRIVDWAKLRRNPVYVYGDDIVMPSVFAEDAMSLLEEVGLKVNKSKSFVRGPFRESCGKEYFRGVDITPVRLRTLPIDDIPARMKIIAFHNNVYRRYGIQPDWLSNLIHEWYPQVPERTTKYHLPRTDRVSGFLSMVPLWGHSDDDLVDGASESAVLDVYRADNSLLPRRLNKKLNRFEYRFLAVVPKYVKYSSDRWSQVLRALVNPKKTQVILDKVNKRPADSARDALSKRVGYKYRWANLH